MSPDEARRRHARWRFFQIAFVFTYLGVVLDVVTTAMGTAQAGSIRAYEQNPVGALLIGNLGWLGLLAAMTAVCLFAYASCRFAYARASLRWLRVVNWLVLFVSALRWLAVVTAIMYLVHWNM
jgi:hypothetical protein